MFARKLSRPHASPIFTVDVVNRAWRQSMTTATNPRERRLYPRTQVQMTVQVLRMEPNGGDLVDQIQMVDISRGGIGAMTDRAFYPGQRLVLKLPAPGMDVRSICGTVRRCHRRGEQHMIGVEFDHPIASLCVDSESSSVAAAAA